MKIDSKNVLGTYCRGKAVSAVYWNSKNGVLIPFMPVGSEYLFRQNKITNVKDNLFRKNKITNAVEYICRVEK